MSYERLPGGGVSIELGTNHEVPSPEPAWKRLRASIIPGSRYDKVERALSEDDTDPQENKRLLRWYQRVKHATQGSLLSDGIILSTSLEQKCILAQGESIAQGMSNITDILKDDSTPGLHICGLSAQDDGILSAYSFPYQVYLTLAGQWSQASHLDQALMGRLLMRYWAHNRLEREVVRMVVRQPQPMEVHWRPQLPSETAKRVILPPQSAPEVCRGSNHLNASTWPHVFHLEWKWLARPHPYENDMDIYVWQPFRYKKSPEFIRLVAFGQADRPERRVLVMASSTALLHRLGEQPQNFGRIPSVTDEDQIADEELFRLFKAIYSLMREDIVELLIEGRKRLDKLDMRSRRSPSAWKSQLFSHLQECFLDAANECEINIRTLEMLVAYAQDPEAQGDARFSAVLEDMKEYEADLQALTQQLRAMADEVPALKKMLQEQVNIVSEYRNVVIGVLVALYVPISFVSSFLGMNIRDASTNTYWNNLTVAPAVPTIMPNSSHLRLRDVYPGSPANTTFQLISANQPGTKLWGLNSFWVSAFPLAFGTIIIPLLAGPLFRIVVQTASRHQMWWRVLLMLLTICIIVAINVAPNVAANLLPGYIKMDPKVSVDISYAGRIILSVEYGLLALFCLWHFFVAARLWPRWSMLAGWLIVFALSTLALVLELSPSFSNSWYDDSFDTWAAYYGFWICIPLMPWFAVFLHWIFWPRHFFTPMEYRRQRRTRDEAKIG